MLVLTRRQGEVLTIDGDIIIQVLEVKGKQVRIGIEAPKNKKIQRNELINRIVSNDNFNRESTSQPNSL